MLLTNKIHIEIKAIPKVHAATFGKKYFFRTNESSQCQKESKMKSEKSPQVIAKNYNFFLIKGVNKQQTCSSGSFFYVSVLPSSHAYQKFSLR